MSYSIEVLNEFASNFNATPIEPLPPLKKEARITFRCGCGTITDKSFVRLKVSGMLCPPCTLKSRREKCEATNLERYGATCSLQAETISAKAKDTLLQRFGVDNPFKLREMQDKIKQTNLEKYGVENPYASPMIIRKIRDTCLKKYGTEFPMQMPEIRQKTVITNLERYGVPVSSQAECVKQKAISTNMAKYGQTHHITNDVKEKAKVTSMVRYGVPYTFQATSVKHKIIQTCLKRYGVKYVSQCKTIRDKCKQTNMNRRGCKYPMQSPVCLQKRVVTYLNKYGVAHPLQSSEVQAKIQKSGFRFKNYITPNGDIRKVQGFEPKALKILFKDQQLDGSNVVTERIEVPRIIYTYNGSEKYYFPDIYIPSQNKLIEVKSTWTYQLHKETNLLKCAAAKAAGYNFEFWIFDKSNNPTII